MARRGTREQRREAIRLDRIGRTHGEIAIRLGFSTTTIRRWVNPDYSRQARADVARWREQHPEELAAYYARERRDGICGDCGAPVAKPGTRQCTNCRQADTDFLRAEIAKLWNQDHLTGPEVAAILRRSLASIQMHMTRMRRDGWTLERRR